MSIYLVTLTRDRLKYTQDCFAQLHRMAGTSFHHLVIDNGSKDGTPEWLRTKYQNQNPNTHVLCLPENVGISKGMNLSRDILRHMNLEPNDLVIKFDNDCCIKSDGTLRGVENFYSKLPNMPLTTYWFISPSVSGLRNKVGRHETYSMNGYTLGRTSIIGGIFQSWHADLFLSWRDDETLPKAWGQDDMLAKVGAEKGWLFGYLEDYEVEHYRSTDQQWIDYPQYYKRKIIEEADHKFPTGS